MFLFISGPLWADVTLCFGKTCFEAEVADTPQKRRTGLMNRHSMPPDRGMLFILDYERAVAFWMKNTTIPLDIIWMDSQMKVVDIKERTKPLDETPLFSKRPAKYVFEVNGGTVKKFRLKVGDRATIKP